MSGRRSGGIRRRRAGPLAGGVVLLLLLWGAALAAPLLAGERPLVQRTGGRTWFPALADLPLLGVLFARQAPPPRHGDLRILPPIPHSPTRTDLSRVRLPPGDGHPLGTDLLGRDLAARIIHGARPSLLVGGLGTLAALALGLSLGGVAGLAGGRLDRGIGILVDVALCFPSLVLAMALVAATGARGLGALAAIIAITRWARIARIARGEFLRLRGAPLLAAARAGGAPTSRILVRHLLPNALAPVLVTAAFSAAGAILLEGSLSFLGLGVPPPHPSWGGLLAEAREAGGAWWLTLFPGLALLAALGGYGLLGEGLLDRLDPRRYSARAGGTPARATAA